MWRPGAELLAVLWGRHAPLTDLFRTLASHLGDLDGDKEVFVPIGALTPREVSIIDVQTLKELDGEAEGDLQPVAVRTAGGASTHVPRGELTALVAEMIVPMAGVPWDFMKETDLLDFPGTRNRFTHNLQKFLVHGEAPLAQLFLRGKVAFLFDRYVAEQEMTSMVLCVGEGNMEAKDLPGLVEKWVAATHGATPQQRAKARCILFFVLTKFDTLLVEAGGSGDDPTTRFQRRVQNSMIEPFAKMPDAWINEWVPGEPFRNTFWLRNPTYETPVIAYGENKREIDIREDMLKRVETLREGAVNAPLVRRHFTDPQAAWEAAMGIDDGGVTRLAGALGTVCRQQTKLDQVSDQLEMQIGNIERPPFPVPHLDGYRQKAGTQEGCGRCRRRCTQRMLRGEPLGRTHGGVDDRSRLGGGPDGAHSGRYLHRRRCRIVGRPANCIGRNGGASRTSRPTAPRKPSPPRGPVESGERGTGIAPGERGCRTEGPADDDGGLPGGPCADGLDQRTA